MCAFLGLLELITTMSLPPAINLFLHVWTTLTLNLELIATGYPFLNVIMEKVVVE